MSSRSRQEEEAAAEEERPDNLPAGDTAGVRSCRQTSLRLFVILIFLYATKCVHLGKTQPVQMKVEIVPQSDLPDSPVCVHWEGAEPGSIAPFPAPRSELFLAVQISHILSRVSKQDRCCPCLFEGMNSTGGQFLHIAPLNNKITSNKQYNNNK